MFHPTPQNDQPIHQLRKPIEEKEGLEELEIEKLPYAIESISAKENGSGRPLSSLPASLSMLLLSSSHRSGRLRCCVSATKAVGA